MNRLSVDIIIPAYNEQNCLKRNMLILYHHLEKITDFHWNIVIANNASSDNTLQIARELSSKYEKIQYIHFPVKGRGYVLKKTFIQSNADVLCYMDADLSTNLHYLKPLIKGVVCGFDVAIGSRLIRGSKVKRRLNREIVSRIYNSMIKCLFFNGFSDAQCGFKALRANVAKQLIPMVKSNSWFFDTELLLLAEYNKYKIFEVPVEWIEDIKTKVNLIKTILENLLGFMRMRCTIHKCKIKDRIVGWK